MQPESGKNFISLNRELNRKTNLKKRVLSRQDNYDINRGICDNSDPEMVNKVETSREMMLKKWKAQKEFKKKEQDLKKPTFTVRTASKIPSTVSIKNASSFTKKTFPSKMYEKSPLKASRILPKKTIPKITVSSLPKPTLPSKKCEDNISDGLTSHKTIPKSNLPSMKTAATSNVVSTSTVKPSKLPEKNKVNFSNIPKTTFHKTVPRLFLFGNKSTEKAAIKSNFDKNKTKATDSRNQASLLSCNVSHIEDKVDNLKIKNLEDTLCTKNTSLTPNPEIKLRTSTPLKEACIDMQKSPKYEEPDTVALLEDFSSSLQLSCKSEKDSTIIEKSDKKTLGTCFKNSKNNLCKEKVQTPMLTQSFNEEFAKLKVEEIDLKNCKSEETQIANIKEFESQIQTPISLSCIKNLKMENTPFRHSKSFIEQNNISSLENLQSTEEPEIKSNETCKREESLIEVMKDLKLQMQTPKSLHCVKIQDTDKITPRRSQRIKEKNEKVSCINLQSVAKPPEIKLVDLESCKKEKTQIDNTSKCSQRLTKKEERKDSFDDLFNMPRPSVMGFDTDDSLESPAATASKISYNFDNLDYEDEHTYEKKNKTNLKKVSLLYDPERRQTRFTSIPDELLTFSPPE